MNRRSFPFSFHTRMPYLAVRIAVDASSTIWNNNGKSQPLVLLLSPVFSIENDVCCGFCTVFFIISEKFPFIPSLLSGYIMKCHWTLLKVSCEQWIGSRVSILHRGCGLLYRLVSVSRKTLEFLVWRHLLMVHNALMCRWSPVTTILRKILPSAFIRNTGLWFSVLVMYLCDLTGLGLVHLVRC